MYGLAWSRVKGYQHRDDDPYSDDEGLADVAKASSFSSSQESPGAKGGHMPYESGGLVNDAGNSDSGMNPTKIWTCDLTFSSETTDAGGNRDGAADLPAGTTLTVVHHNGMWHYNLQIDPAMNIERDGYVEVIRNSSFSISKRSARTGRN